MEELAKTGAKGIENLLTRIDSLLFYQRKLHDIIYTTSKDEVKVKAVSESDNIFSLWKQLPAFDIVDKSVKENKDKQNPSEEEAIYGS